LEKISDKRTFMKRSEINRLIRNSLDFFEQMNFKLPPWANWKPEDWKGKYDSCQEIIDNVLGWDLTDFGGGEFHKRGLILFTIRNGNLQKDKKLYAEKIMIVEEEQETPMHFHWYKMEDIINRGGGNLVINLYQSDKNGKFSHENIDVKIDGINRKVAAGGSVTLHPGESICLNQGVYHSFYGEKGKGMVLVGEVSTVNDDRTDNKFYEPVGRFPEIIEDEAPIHLLATDYKNYI
jgi:D-lyxose ketol-isomerase